MTATLLAEYDRKARKFLVCQICHREITPGTNYLEQRIADEGSAYTFRAHHACDSAYWSWVDPFSGDVYDLRDLTPHLPPCWHAWDRDSHRGYFVPFIGPRPPCTCGADA